MSSEIQLAPKGCHDYKEFSKQGRCPLTSVCNEDCVFVWKKCYEDLNKCGCKDIDNIEELKEEIESLQIENSQLDSDYDEIYWEKDEIENQYKQTITALANYLDNRSFEKLRKLNLEGKVSDWFDDLDLEKRSLRVEGKVVDVQSE